MTGTSPYQKRGAPMARGRYDVFGTSPLSQLILSDAHISSHFLASWILKQRKYDHSTSLFQYICLVHTQLLMYNGWLSLTRKCSALVTKCRFFLPDLTSSLIVSKLVWQTPFCCHTIACHIQHLPSKYRKEEYIIFSCIKPTQLNFLKLDS